MVSRQTVRKSCTNSSAVSAIFAPVSFRNFLMIFSEASIEKLIVHVVGNKLQDTGVKISRKQIEFTDENSWTVLRDALLTPFINQEEFFTFDHPSSLKYNEVYGYVSGYLDGEFNFNKLSSEIARHLYESSIHPKIKSGELFVLHIKDCVVDDEDVDAIGIFKTESKESFLKIISDESGVALDVEDGVNPRKGFLKACLIFNTDRKAGYKVCILDQQGGSVEAQYWKDTFLKLKPRADEYHQTQNFLKVCKEFVATQLPEEYEVSKTEQIGYLNRSMEYFKKQEQFNETEFNKEVFEDSQLISSFKKFKSQYQENNDIEIEEQFDVSAPAVKKQNKVFKSVLKLDRNFHIYIHGDKELIERGTEKDGRKFYKIYYDKEL